MESMEKKQAYGFTLIKEALIKSPYTKDLGILAKTMGDVMYRSILMQAQALNEGKSSSGECIQEIYKIAEQVATYVDLIETLREIQICAGLDNNK